MSENKRSLQPANQTGGLRTIQEFLEKHKGVVAKTLPKQAELEPFLRSIMMAARKDPKLLEASPQSLFAAAIVGAQLGLQMNTPLQHAFLLPFRNRKLGTTEVQFVPGYRGLVDLARRSGQIQSIMAEVVRPGDDFDFQFGTDPYLRHRPGKGWSPDFYAAYAVAKLSGGETQFAVMDIEEINHIMVNHTQSKGQFGPWKDHKSEMAKKTAIRRLCKMLPMSLELARATALDGEDSDEAPNLVGEVFEGTAVVEESSVGQTFPGVVEGPPEPTEESPKPEQPVSQSRQEEAAPPPPEPVFISREVVDTMLRSVAEAPTLEVLDGALAAFEDEPEHFRRIDLHSARMLGKQRRAALQADPPPKKRVPRKKKEDSGQEQDQSQEDDQGGDKQPIQGTAAPVPAKTSPPDPGRSQTEDQSPEDVARRMEMALKHSADLHSLHEIWNRVSQKRGFLGEELFNSLKQTYGGRDMALSRTPPAEEKPATSPSPVILKEGDRIASPGQVWDRSKNKWVSGMDAFLVELDGCRNHDQFKWVANRLSDNGDKYGLTKEHEDDVKSEFRDAYLAKEAGNISSVNELLRQIQL